MILLLDLPLLLSSAAGAFQGCAQCLDNAAATPPETQAAYRHAILLLISTAVLVFVAGVALLRRNR